MSLQGALTLQQQLQLLTLPKPVRRRILMRTANTVRKNSRGRIRQQKTLSGSKFAPRKNGKKRKMLKGLIKKMEVIGNDQQAKVTFNNRNSAMIAADHQHGIAQPYSKNRAKSNYGTPDYSQPATKGQARALIREGYKRPKANGKGFARASQAWIRNNLKMGQAAMILQALRGDEDERKPKRWEIPVEARPFLGATDAEIQERTQEIMNGILASMRRQGR